MRIAIVSYEFPPETALGGIATYVRDAATMLSEAGHEVEVFCGGVSDASTREENGARVHHFATPREHFPSRIVPAFIERHRVRPFDVLEGPDYLAEAWEVVQALPRLPYVVKLHTPFFILQEILDGLTPWSERARHLRVLFFQLRRKRRPLRPWRNEAIPQRERLNARAAAMIASPTRSIGDRVAKAWRLPADRIAFFPFPFIPDAAFLQLAPAPASKVIGYVGRLEPRKGVHVLAEAMRLVWRRVPDARLRLIGRDMPSHQPGRSMARLVAEVVGPRVNQIEFVGPVSRERLPELLADVGGCVFPSIWESFGFVVLEAVAAGRPLICSHGSGMAEILGPGPHGRFAKPGDPSSLASTILRHFENNESGRPHDAATCRREVLPRFLPNEVLPQQIACYQRAIELGNPSPSQ